MLLSSLYAFPVSIQQQKAFVKEMSVVVKMAISDAKAMGLEVPTAELVIRVAALETGYGTSYLCRHAKNYFGIRAKAGHPHILRHDDGAMRRFAKHGTAYNSVIAFIRLLNSSKRYSRVFKEKTTYWQAYALQQAYYSSRRDYHKRLCKLNI